MVRRQGVLVNVLPLMHCSIPTPAEALGAMVDELLEAHENMTYSANLEASISCICGALVPASPLLADLNTIQASPGNH